MSKSRSSGCYGKPSADGTTAQGQGRVSPMNTPAQWLIARFDIYGHPLDTNYNIGAMISLRSVMDAGPAMSVDQADYADPARVWL